MSAYGPNATRFANTASEPARVYGPSSRRFIVTQSGWQTRVQRVGSSLIGTELVRVNLPRSRSRAHGNGLVIREADRAVLNTITVV